MPSSIETQSILECDNLVCIIFLQSLRKLIFSCIEIGYVGLVMLFMMKLKFEILQLFASIHYKLLNLHNFSANYWFKGFVIVGKIRQSVFRTNEAGYNTRKVIRKIINSESFRFTIYSEGTHFPRGEIFCFKANILFQMMFDKNERIMICYVINTDRFCMLKSVLLDEDIY